MRSCYPLTILTDLGIEVGRKLSSYYSTIRSKCSLKAAIRHRQGKIRQPRKKQTIGFDACVRKGLTDGALRFLSDEQALTLQTINGQRGRHAALLARYVGTPAILLCPSGSNSFPRYSRRCFRPKACAGTARTSASRLDDGTAGLVSVIRQGGRGDKRALGSWHKEEDGCHRQGAKSGRA